ncbi:hypothetical protein IAE39_002310 [Pseudomonas sp. S37]|uniref:hypothetical protein n=1 Tax=Pseudomonas sp. S37 TaxID=2767449 RepID=UPI00191499E3|nr:hypothetical protein [Pseudomonas sp. S37]MBK4994136.1 hypothetical protein [Pseudomonas sp. S37]
MTSITANLHINVVSAQALSANAAAESEQATQAEKDEPLGSSGDTSKVGGAGQALATEGSEESSDSAGVTALRELIKELQKQLAEEQKQLAQLMSSKMEETAKATAATAKQASIATITGQIMTATAQLLELLQQEGGSSAGGVVSTTA